MCVSCQAFASSIELASAEQLDGFLSRLHHEGLATGILTVSEGSLAWSDSIECLLVCRFCGKRFRLQCETYHGRGGRFGPAA
jgi:hypothetical protein